MERFAAILGLEALDPRRAGAHAPALGLLGQPRHARARLGRVPDHRGAEVRDGLRGRPDPSTSSPSSRSASRRPSRSRWRRCGSHDVETRWTNASLPGRDRGPVGRSPRPTSRSATAAGRMRRPGRGRCSTGSGRGGGGRLVLRRPALEDPRLDGPGRSAGSACGGGAATRSRSSSATRSTSGGSRTWCPASACCCTPRCGCRATPGWSSASARSTGPAIRSELVQTAYFRPTAVLGPALLGPALPDPLVHLPGHGPRHRPGRRADERGRVGRIGRRASRARPSGLRVERVPPLRCGDDRAVTRGSRTPQR